VESILPATRVSGRLFDVGAQVACRHRTAGDATTSPASLQLLECLDVKVSILIEIMTEPFGHLTLSLAIPTWEKSTEPFGQSPLAEGAMSGYRKLSERARPTETEGDWVDFPTSPDPDPWATLLRTGHHLPADFQGVRPGNTPGVGAAEKPVVRDAFETRRRFSSGDHWDAGRVGGAVMMALGIAVRGLLVTTTAVGMVAYLLLTNSHI
jgi:hypothetical protein